MPPIEKIRAIALDQNGEAIQGIPLGVGSIIEQVPIADQGSLDWDVSGFAVIQWDSSEQLKFSVNDETAVYLSSAERYPLTEGVVKIVFFNDSGAPATLNRLARAKK